LAAGSLEELVDEVNQVPAKGGAPATAAVLVVAGDETVVSQRVAGWDPPEIGGY